MLKTMRHPKLFVLVLGLFLLDLVTPDFIPFIDELILGGLTLAIGTLRQRPDAQSKAPGTKAPGTPEVEEKRED